MGIEDQKGCSKQRSTQTDAPSNKISRRPFLKLASTGAVAGIAGCGGTDSEEDATSGDTDDKGANATQDAKGQDGEFSGVSFDYWNSLNAQSRSADQASKELVNTFQSESGADVSVNWSSGNAVITRKWSQKFKQGNYPVAFDTYNQYSGQFIEGDWVKPFDEYQDAFDDSVIDQIEHTFDATTSQFSGFSGADQYMVPWGMYTMSPYVARMDHFEEAGLDPNKDFPPKDFEHLVEVATTLKENGPTQWGFQIQGDAGDILDTILPTFTVAAGGNEGLLWNQDWSDTNLDNDIQKEWFAKHNKLFLEHEVSNPQSPQMSDEEASNLIAAGRISMTQIGAPNHPKIAEQAQQAVEDGTIQYGVPWGGPEEQMGVHRFFSNGITVAPDDADQAKYERKQEAAIEFYKYWLQENFQDGMYDTLGVLPVREDMIEKVPDTPHNLTNTLKTMATNTDMAWSAHPNQMAVMYNIPIAQMQNAMKGEISAEEALNEAADRVRDEVL